MIGFFGGWGQGALLGNALDRHGATRLAMTGWGRLWDDVGVEVLPVGVG